MWATANDGFPLVDSRYGILALDLQSVGLCLLDPLWSQVFGIRAAALGLAHRSAVLRGRRSPAEPVIRGKSDSSLSN